MRSIKELKEPRIVIEPPGSKAKEIVERDKKVLMTTTKILPVVGVRGEGCFVEDIDGNIFMDFSSAIAVMSTGYSHPRIVEAVKKQAEKLIHFAAQDYYNERQVELAEKIVELSPEQMKPVKVFLSNSGTESVEAAYKMVRRSTRKPLAIAFIGAFHGRTLGSLSLTGSKAVHRAKYQPLQPVIHAPYAYCYRCRFKLEYPSCGVWCAKYIEEVLLDSIAPPEDVAFIILEPVQGEGGYIVGPKEFYREIRRICDKYDIALIDDEVQAGVFRTGKFLAIENFDVTPDLYTLAKAIASGLPMGVTVAREKYMFKEEGAHSNTFGGNLLSCVAAIETLNVILEEKLHENAVKVGEEIMKIGREWVENYEIVGDVRGLGPMIGVEIVKDKKTKDYAPEIRKKIIEKSFKKGLILLPCGKSTIRIAPPLNITAEQARKGMEIMEEAIKEVMRSM